jgi:peptidylprolyl isomerase
MTMTPLKVIVAAAILGGGAAVIVSMQQPPAPPEEGLTEAAPPGTQPAAPTSPAVQAAASVALAAGARHTTPSGLTIIQVKDGTGPAAKTGDKVFVHYVGRLYSDGTQFDSSYDRGEPISLTLGNGEVIKGWEEGIAGMKVGEKRELLIPPDLAYGDRAMGDKIPPNSTLLFDVELMNIQPPPSP